MAIRVGPLVAAGGGVILLWSAVTGRKWSSVFKSVIKGENPTKVSPSNQITSLGAGGYGYSAGIFPGNPPIGEISGGSNQAIAKGLLPHYGWSPAEIIPLIALWTQESGWNPLIRNTSSGALGIAQALGHGVAGGAGSLGNEYGGYGLTPAEAARANSGSPEWQIIWGLNYIKSTYGSPSAAWAHEQSHNWY